MLSNKVKFASYLGSGAVVLPGGPVNTVAPTVTGAAKVGTVLTGATGTWTGTPAPTLTRQWRANGVDIAGATAGTYTPVSGDIGKTITLSVRGTNINGTRVVISAATAAVIP